MIQLFDAVLRKFCAYIADYGNRAGNAHEITKAFEAYDSLIQDIGCGVSSEDLTRNELFQKSSDNGSARVA